MSSYILSLQEIDKSMLSLAGGKGANLGELTGMVEVQVPEGFCITTGAFKRIIAENPHIAKLGGQLSFLKGEDRDEIGKLSNVIRQAIEDAPIPLDMTEEITGFLSRFGERNAYAVRSSATAEDLPSASFAGQQDTYLNIIGIKAMLKHISRCWASLFTERAILYRLQNGFGHDKVTLAVIVQKMIFSQVAGILFTADPVTADTKQSSIDASFGLGEALVAGLVNADNYKVRNGEIIDKRISAKKLAVYASKDGGTSKQQIESGKQNIPALTDDQILQLERLGRTVAQHFGRPQDIEWCLADDKFYIVQSRPITTIYPAPEEKDQENHVYISVGHNQMMTDAIRPLGLSFFLLVTRAPMRVAAGRLFIDVSKQLSSPDSAKILVENFGKSDPLIKDALMTVIERGNFIKQVPDDKKEPDNTKSNKVVSPFSSQKPIENDPAIVAGLIKRSQSSIETLKQKIRTKSGTDLFDFILDDLQELKNILFDPQSAAVYTAAIDATFWINDNISHWLGEKGVADTLTQSVPGNITSEMGLALLDVADAIRPYPAIIDYLQQVKEDNFLEMLVKFDGGQEVRDAINGYLNKYGMRCVGEIDMTKTRWSEKPLTLVPMILSNIKNFGPDAGTRKFEQGRQEALSKEQEILERLKLLPGGEQKAKVTQQKISLLRNFIGYREYPKYGLVSRYFIYKMALLKEAARLVKMGVIHDRADIYYLSFEEFHEAVRTNKLDYQVIDRRKEEYKRYEKLTPPRVITSDGEIITGKYKRENIPAGALVGWPVSSGVIEGRARVILNMENASLEKDDILVTSFTDPSWTPLFVSIKGLVTEVGGIMTHGAVIAREYGLPAVIGIENATRLIKDGQRIRVHGTEGYVELL